MKTEVKIEAKPGGAQPALPIASASAPTPEALPTIRQAICPGCGRAAGFLWQRDLLSRAKLERLNYWERTRDFAADKPFGVIQQAGIANLRGFEVIGYFEPEEDIDGFFPWVKDRLLEAVKEWVLKGWLTREEVQEVS